MSVNSRRGPLNCSEYDSALVTTDAQLPAAGTTVGLIHTSTENAVVKSSVALSATSSQSFVPSTVTARFAASLVSSDGWLSRTPWRYVPALRAFTSAAAVPVVSPRRQ